MLSVTKLSPGQEAYYERSVAKGLDDYYAGRGESPGVWAGRGAALLGLHGVVADEQLGQLVQGVDPRTGRRLRSHPKKRTTQVERLDPLTGMRRLEIKELDPVAGFDLVFSVPKSVSLLHALGDHGLRLTITRAHEAAWRAALRYLEDEACVTRRGRNGVMREQASGFAAAAFQHRTSRAQDPHLHTHVIVANMAQSPVDGTWRALDGEPILSGYRLAAGYLYEAHLRAELARALGVEWTEPVKGMGEVVGVPHEVLVEFSQRRQRVVEYLSRTGSTSWRAAQVAALETRERKEFVDLDVLREAWEARAGEHGFGRREREAVLGRASWRALRQPERRAVAERLLGRHGLTEKQTTFSDPDLVKAWAEAHTAGADADQVRVLAQNFTRVVGVTAVAPGRPGRAARYSTRELLRLEQRALRLVDEARANSAPVVDQTVVEAVLAGRRAAGRPLAHDQEAMLHRVGKTADGVVCVVGKAGAGKTTALHAVAEAFAAESAPLVGAAPSGHAAEKLEDETGIPSFTLHRLLDLAARESGLPRRCVVVIDEAGMAETRTLVPVLDLVLRSDGKAVLVGDPGQLPAVGAGGLFPAIVERLGATELTQNRRQHDPGERAALARIRAGWGRDYLEWADHHGRLVRCGDPVGARSRLLADWWAAARSDLSGSVMIAFERRDVAELNALGRALMRSGGRLGTDELVVCGTAFAVGDRIVCLRNNDYLGVKNGTRGTIRGVDVDRHRVAFRSDRGEVVTLSAAYVEAGHVSHAYALTGHAGQGATVQRAFVLGHDRGRLQEWGYVALSRAREATHIYVTALDRVADPHAHAHAHDGAPLERLASALEASAAESLASHTSPTVKPHRPGWEQPNELTVDARSRLREIEQRRRALLAGGRRRSSGMDEIKSALADLDRAGAAVRGASPRMGIGTDRGVDGIGR